LGRYTFLGLGSQDYRQMIAGCLLVIALARVLDLSLLLIQRLTSARGLRAACARLRPIRATAGPLPPSDPSPPTRRRTPMTTHSTRRHLLGMLAASGAALGAAACGSSDPVAEDQEEAEPGGPGGCDGGRGHARG